RVEDQFLRQVARVPLPKLHEPEDLIRLLGFGEARLAVAEHALGGVAGQKDQDPLLTAAPAGDVVLFQRLDLGIGGHGVEVPMSSRRPIPPAGGPCAAAKTPRTGGSHPAAWLWGGPLGCSRARARWRRGPERPGSPSDCGSGWRRSAFPAARPGHWRARCGSP